MGLQFQVMSAAADEWMDPTKPVEEEIGRVSRLKAEAVLAQAPQGACIIAADTLVCIDGQRLGKPRDEAEAEAMLRRLSGRDHTVMTGVSVLRGDRVETFTEKTQIHFRPLSGPEIRAYVATASRWIRPARTASRAGRRCLSAPSAAIITMLWGCRYAV